MAKNKSKPNKRKPKKISNGDHSRFLGNTKVISKRVFSWFSNVLVNFKKTHLILFNFLGALILGAPPYLIIHYYQIESFAEEVKKLIPFIGPLLDNNVIWGVVLSGAWIFIWLTVYNFLKKMVSKSPDRWVDIPQVLLSTLDNIVGVKEQRFRRELLRMQNNPDIANSDGDIFRNITNPTDQLKELIKGVYTAINVLIQKDPSVQNYQLKVNLAAINADRNIEKIFFHHPSNHPVRSTLENLNKPNSTIKIAVNSRKIVVIESVLDESKRPSPKFAVTDHSRDEEDGSLICFPVFYEPLNQVIFVISVFIDVPYYFKSKFSKTYTALLKLFELRSKLEYALLGLHSRGQ